MNPINILKYCFALSIFSVFISCSKNNDKAAPDELEGLVKVTSMSNDKHKIDLYTANGKFQTGFNAIAFQIKNADGSLVNNATVTWQPVMHMMMMSHACPASSIAKQSNAASTYAGYMVFQMAGNEAEYWELTLNYTIDGKDYSVKDKIQVTAAPKRVVESFQGTDGVRYVLAMAAPASPKVAVNDMTAVLYKMESMMSFVPVDNYKIIIDPRMPGMGNHGSPNNVDLTQTTDKAYRGKLSLTMTGYWKINLQLADATGKVLKGEPVSGENEGSSIYFELEF